jgi:hypothetical protein
VFAATPFSFSALPISFSVIAGLDPRLSGSILVDRVHGVDSSVF